MAIARVHVESWRYAYRGIIAASYLAEVTVEERAATWLERLRADPERRALIFVAEDLGGVVGFVSGGKTRQPALPFDAELYALYIKPDHQRRGVGRQLTLTLANELIKGGFRGLVVGVLQANEMGRRFYESMGGRRVGDHSRIIGGDAHSEVFYGWSAIKALGGLTTG